MKFKDFLSEDWKPIPETHPYGDGSHRIICPSCGQWKEIYERDKVLAKAIADRFGRHIRTKSSKCDNCDTKFKVIKGIPSYYR